MFTISVPITVPVSKAKSFSLNLNQYRNAHYQTLNKAKKNFHDQVRPLLKNLPFFEKIILTYTLFPPSHRDLDVANVCSVVDKFFSDTFVSSGRITDDNYKHLSQVTYRFGEVDKTNPRVEVCIEEIKTCHQSPKENPMQVILVQDEIMSALEQYVRGQITINENQKIVIDLKAGRGENGFSATLDIQPANKIMIDSSSFVPAKAEVLAITNHDFNKLTKASAVTATARAATAENSDDVLEEIQDEDSHAVDTPVTPANGSIFSFAKAAESN